MLCCSNFNINILIFKKSCLCTNPAMWIYDDLSCKSNHCAMCLDSPYMSLLSQGEEAQSGRGPQGQRGQTHQDGQLRADPAVEPVSRQHGGVSVQQPVSGLSLT